MLVFIPDGSGLILPTAVLKVPNTQTYNKISMVKVQVGLTVPYSTKNSNNGVKLIGSIFNISPSIKEYVYNGVHLIPEKLTISGRSKQHIYIFVLAPIFPLPRLF